jgi:acyl-CoA oxidase
MASNEHWARIWNTALDGLHKLDPINTSYEESAAFLRSLIKTRLLKHTDLRDNPERFFLAHKLVALKTFQLQWQTGSAFWIRFTVHYNLYVVSPPLTSVSVDDIVVTVKEFPCTK